jgi:hypothetical protein
LPFFINLRQKRNPLTKKNCKTPKLASRAKITLRPVSHTPLCVK